MKIGSLVTIKTSSILVCGIVTSDKEGLTLKDPKLVRYSAESKQVSLEDIILVPDNLFIPTHSIEWVFMVDDNAFVEFYHKNLEPLADAPSEAVIIQ